MNAGITSEACNVTAGAATTYYVNVMDISGLGANFNVAAYNPINEGSVGVPTGISAGITHQGMAAGSGTSYYSVPVNMNTGYTINLTDLSQNFDLRVYSDSAYTVLVGSSLLGGLNNETVNWATSTQTMLYIKVTNVSVTSGVFTLNVIQGAPIVNQGATGAGMQVVLSEGVTYNGTVLSGGSSYYSITVLNATEYTISLTNPTNNFNLYLYSNNTFTTQVGSSLNAGTQAEYITWTTTVTTMYIKVVDLSAAGGTFKLTVARGIVSAPVMLGSAVPGTPITVASNIKGAGGAKYYVMPAAPNGVYSVAISNTPNVDLFVFSDPGFTNQLCYSAFASPSIAIEDACPAFTGTNSNLYIATSSTANNPTYTILVDASPAGTITLGAAWNSLSALVPGYYAVSVTPNQTYTVSWDDSFDSGLNGFTADVAVWAVNKNGSVLFRNVDSGFTTPQVVTPNDNIMYIEINPAWATGTVGVRIQ